MKTYRLFCLCWLCVAALSGVAQTGGVLSRAICTSTCSGNLGENIFPNGDFGQGVPNVVPVNPGFAPGYSYQTNPPPGDGSYTISNSTVNWGLFAATTWIKIEDNGPEPNGYMMVVNASYQPGLFFEKKVAVCENTLYEFSVDVIAMNNAFNDPTIIKPQLAFEIDGKQVCNTNNIPIDATWHTYRFSFSTAPGASEVALGMRNIAPGGYGNDLAIDNISFRACGPDIDVPATAFFCAGQPLTIQAGIADPPYMPVYVQWQAFSPTSNAWENLPGATTPSLTLPQPGDGETYRVVVAGALGNLALPHCRAVSQPAELLLEDLSDFAIGGADTILCNGAPALLKAGAFAAYQWSSGAGQSTLAAPLPGWYAVTVTSANGCTATDSLYVYEAELSAEARWTEPGCAGDTTGWIRFEQRQGNGGPVQFVLNEGAPQAQPLFAGLGAGAYVASVRDSLGCQFDVPLTLQDPPALLLALGEDRDLLVCDSLRLRVQSNFPLLQYQWSPPVGLSCVDCPEPVAMPTAPTVYRLTAFDERGCPGADSLLIRVLPRLDVYAPNVFLRDFSENGPNHSFTLSLSKSATQVRRLAVFDRWGNLVFLAENQAPGAAALVWDGTARDGRLLEAGVFVWSAEVEFTDGSRHRFEGDVLLLQR